MKKLLLLLLALCLFVPVFALTACGDDPEPCTQHVDANGDNTCDVCGHNPVNTTPPPAPGCTHVDADGNFLCDECGELVPHNPVSNGYVQTAAGHKKNVTCCNPHKTEATVEAHTNVDGICSVCGYDSNVVLEECEIKVTPKNGLKSQFAGPVKVFKGVAMTDEQEQAVKDLLYLGRGFAGIYTDSACTIPFNFDTVITGDLTLYGDYGDLAGRNVHWSVADTTLTLTGSGAMFDFQNLNAVPWNGKAISNVVISADITTIGDYSFYSASGSANGVSLPNGFTLHEGITKIGKNAFYGEKNFTSIEFPASLEIIGESAFRNCTGLTYIDIGGSNLELVEKGAFANCSAAEYVIFNTAIETSANVFESCNGIKRAFFAGNKGQYESLEIGFGNSKLTLAYMFFLRPYEQGAPQKPGPYWYEDTQGKPQQWCYSLNYTPSGKNALEPIARDFVLIGQDGKGKLTQDNIDFRNSIWHNGFQYSSWGDTGFAVDAEITGNKTYSGVRGTVVGDGVDYNITGNTLTISGSGKMWDFKIVNAAPWHELPDTTVDVSKISEVVIGPNVTYIGDYAFADFKSLESIEIKSNVVEISTKAFYGSENLKYIYYYGNELEAMNCKGLMNQEGLEKLVVYCKEMALDNICDSCGYCMDAVGTEAGADHVDELCDYCGLCFTHTDANSDNLCDVCEVCMGNHVDEVALDGKCYDCRICITHDSKSDSDEDGVCDACGVCVTHKDTTGEGKCDACDACVGTHADVNTDNICDNCSICIVHVDEGEDNKCDVCEECIAHVNKDGRCDICVTCIEHKDEKNAKGAAEPDGVCDICNKCADAHQSGLCDLCGGCIDHVDILCDVCAVCLNHEYVEGVCTVCGWCEQHTDSDSDGKCDICKACIECVDEKAANGKCQVCSICVDPTKHKDSDSNGKCDICSACVNHEGTGKCDVCNLCKGDHVDSGNDGKCDVCGACITHVNKDGKCDVCRKCLEHVGGKCDICKRCDNEAHVNENGDKKCDKCGACLDHIDKDVNYFIEKEITPTISYWKDIVVSDGVVARITWQFDMATGTLTIGGEGAIKDFKFEAATDAPAWSTETPWANTFSYVTQDGVDLGFTGIDVDVKKIVIRDGITSIGNNAFIGLAAVTEIVLPDGVRRISDTAFVGTAAYDEPTFDENGLYIVGNHLLKVDPATAGTRVLVPQYILSIADGAFDGCTAVTEIRLPNGIAGATEESYRGLTALTTVYVHTSKEAWRNNATKDALPEAATVYYFENIQPAKGEHTADDYHYWYDLNDPKIWDYETAK